MEELEKEKSVLSINGKITSEDSPEYCSLKNISLAHFNPGPRFYNDEKIFGVFEGRKPMTPDELKKQTEYFNPYRKESLMDELDRVTVVNSELINKVREVEFVNPNPEFNRVKETLERLKQTNKEREKLLEKALKWFKEDSPFKRRLNNTTNNF